MAELKDALELLTDPSCLLHVDGPMAQMRAVPILAELQARGADLRRLVRSSSRRSRSSEERIGRTFAAGR